MRTFLKRQHKNVLFALALAYFGCGLIYHIIGLYCYNLRNWEVFGGFSLPPLWLPGIFFDLTMWPVYIWANLINGFGVFGNCTPPPGW